MHSSGSGWMLAAWLLLPLGCGGEVRRNTDPGSSTTQGTSGAGGPLSIGGLQAATGGGVVVVAAAAVGNTSSFGATSGTSDSAGLTGTSAAVSAGGASGTGGAVSTGGTVGNGGAGTHCRAVGMDGAGVGGLGGAAGAAGFSCSEPCELEVARVPTGTYWCAEGYEVREDQVTCPNLLPDKIDGGVLVGEMCTNHAECPGLAFCDFWGGPFGVFCADGCRTDADCESGHICRCGDPIGECFAAGCTTNADCGPGSFCAAVVNTTCTTSYEYACQSAADECQTDADCTELDLGDWCTLVDGVRRCSVKGPCR